MELRDDDTLPFEFAWCVLDTENVVCAVRAEIERMLSDGWRDPKLPSRRFAVEGRPAWWWRVRLVEWATSREARRNCESDALSAFRSFLSDLTDRDLCSFVESLLPGADHLADTA